MDSFLLSAAAVAVAEIGDKTQLLALMLVARFSKPVPILAAILVATLANHAAAAAFGASTASLLGEAALRWIVGASFLAIAIWVLVPDLADDGDRLSGRFGPFGTTLVAFFLAEIGDKTQIATIALAARYDAIVSVTAGTTLGLLLANLPVVLFGGLAAGRLPMQAIRFVAAAAFALMAVATLAKPVMAVVADLLAR